MGLTSRQAIGSVAHMSVNFLKYRIHEGQWDLSSDIQQGLLHLTLLLGKFLGASFLVGLLL